MSPELDRDAAVDQPCILPAFRHDDVAAPVALPADVGCRGGLRERLQNLKQQLALRASIPLRWCLGNRVTGAFGILMYHRVTPLVPGHPEPTWNVTPERFRAQLAGLLDRGFVAWPLRRVLDHHRAGTPIPRHVFVVTFDDGYENVYLHAWPVLRALNVPATIFLATAYLDSDVPFPFDDWPGKGRDSVPAESWRPLTTLQCHEMADSGLIELGVHTHTHDDFRRRPHDLMADLELARHALYERFGLDDVTFAFPYGVRALGFSGGELAEAARQAGMLCSLTTEEQLVRPHDDPADWGRFTAAQTDTAETLAAKLSGWFDGARSVWRVLRQGLRPGQHPRHGDAHPCALSTTTPN